MQTPATVSKIYHSREDRIAALHSDAERLSYDGRDYDRLDGVADLLATSCEKLDDKIANFCDALTQDNDEELEYARREVIERWAMAQAALSKVAWVMRFDGNAAYERLVNVIGTDAAVDMRGL